MSSLAFEVCRVAEAFYCSTQTGLIEQLQLMIKTIVNKGLTTHGIELTEIDRVLNDIDSALIVITGFKVARLCLKAMWYENTCTKDRDTEHANRDI